MSSEADWNLYIEKLVSMLVDSSVFVLGLGIPIVAYAVLSRRLGWRGRIAIGTMVVGFVAWLVTSSHRAYAYELGVIALGMAYFVACAAAVFLAHRYRASARLDRVAMFMLAAFLFVLVPAIVTPEAGRLIVLLCGWEMMLSAYSFYVDAANSRKQLGLVDCLVFVVVNPCLVLAESGKVVGAPRLDPRGLARIALGVLALFGHAALFVGIQLFSGLSDERFASWPALSELPLLIAFYSLHVLLGYMTHSGRASIQIGMMRLMGHELPERYHYPLLAKDPADFWRRWNIYVGVWFRRYVFFPLTVAFSRRVPRRLKNVAMPIAVLATFAACGVWHEMAVYARTGAMQFGMTIVFLLHGALLIGWAGTAALVARRTRWIPQLRLVGASVSRVCFLPALSILTWLILPSVAGVGMHPVLGDMLRWVSR